MELLLPKFSTVFGEQLGVMLVPWSWVSKVFMDRETHRQSLQWNEHRALPSCPASDCLHSWLKTMPVGSERCKWTAGVESANSVPCVQTDAEGMTNRSQEQWAPGTWFWMRVNVQFWLYTLVMKTRQRNAKNTKHLLSMHFLLQLFRYLF